MKICVSPRRAVRYLLLIIFALVSASLVLNLIRIYTGHETLFNLLDLLDVNEEGNLPALFSVLILLAASILLYVISLDNKRSGNAYKLWLGLALIFCFLAFDEGAAIHEIVANWVRALLKTSGAFIFAWVIPYGILVMVFAMTYFRFWMALHKETKIWMAIAFITYVCGAVGWEMLESLNCSKYGLNWGLEYTLMYHAEEFMEMLGVTFFLYALLRYIQRNSISVTLCCPPLPEDEV